MLHQIAGCPAGSTPLQCVAELARIAVARWKQASKVELRTYIRTIQDVPIQNGPAQDLLSLLDEALKELLALGELAECLPNVYVPVPVHHFALDGYFFLIGCSTSSQLAQACTFRGDSIVRWYAIPPEESVARELSDYLIPASIIKIANRYNTSYQAPCGEFYTELWNSICQNDSFQPILNANYVTYTGSGGFYSREAAHLANPNNQYGAHPNVPNGYYPSISTTNIPQSCYLIHKISQNDSEAITISWELLEYLILAKRIASGEDVIALNPIAQSITPCCPLPKEAYHLLKSTCAEVNNHHFCYDTAEGMNLIAELIRQRFS